jgi:hypothetical protein
MVSLFIFRRHVDQPESLLILSSHVSYNRGTTPLMSHVADEAHRPSILFYLGMFGVK